MGDIPAESQKDFQYLKGLSDKGTLQASNAVYQKLDAKAKNLPGLRRALGTLNVRY